MERKDQLWKMYKEEKHKKNVDRDNLSINSHRDVLYILINLIVIVYNGRLTN